MGDSKSLSSQSTNLGILFLFHLSGGCGAGIKSKSSEQLEEIIVWKLEELAIEVVSNDECVVQAAFIILEEFSCFPRIYESVVMVLETALYESIDMCGTILKNNKHVQYLFPNK